MARKIAAVVARTLLDTVPESRLPDIAQLKALKHFIRDSDRLLVITGAGVSTESGIRDYRSKDKGLYTKLRKPMLTFPEFYSSEEARKRYWLRSLVSWPALKQAQPNATHLAFADPCFHRHHIITQNIDGLHKKAGSKDVIEYHGTLHKVRCISCDILLNRESMQDKLMSLNSTWLKQVQPFERVELDGDVPVDSEAMKDFKVPNCFRCDGMLKSDVIFFGQEVPSKVEEEVEKLIEDSNSILVAGSSLQVFRLGLVKVMKKKLAIVNIGPTAYDDDACLKIDARCGDVFPELRNVPYH